MADKRKTTRAVLPPSGAGSVWYVCPRCADTIPSAGVLPGIVPCVQCLLQYGERVACVVVKE